LKIISPPALKQPCKLSPPVYPQKYFILLFLASFWLFACNNKDSQVSADSHNGNIRPPTGMVYIPSGEFIRGTTPNQEPVDSDNLPEVLKNCYQTESPQRKIRLKGFYIDKYEVTFLEYNVFLKATGRPLPKGWRGYDFSHSPNYPVFGITWAEATAYAKWAGKRLPSEAEWEKAARGTDGRRYVWGNELYEGFVNLLVKVKPAGDRAIDKSPYRVFDMAGNVAEWTADDFGPYPGSDYHDSQYGKKTKVVRGYFSPEKKVSHFAEIVYRSAARYGVPAQKSSYSIGFRCVMDIDSTNTVTEKTREETTEIEMVYIPPGKFVMGTDKEKENPVPESYGLKNPAYLDETPLQEVYLGGFYIDRYEVTIEQFRGFLKAKDRPSPSQWDKIDLPEDKKGELPAFAVTWAEAAEYARWAGKRLPSEEEWEKAARGANGIRFLWGKKGSDIPEGFLLKSLIAVNKSDRDRSPYGVIGMGGNVSEWTNSWYEPYPENRHSNQDYGKKFKVVRGTSFKEAGHYNIPYFFRLAHRGHVDPTERYTNIGFRCAKDLKKVALAPR
jgi:formylglycine-generating enzyme required for sulfatase activity